MSAFLVLKRLLSLPLRRSFAATRALSAQADMDVARLSKPSADPLGDQMKRYEVETCDAVVDRSRPVVVRLDGHCFSTFTRGFDRPYDMRIHRAMVATATDLLERVPLRVTIRCPSANSAHTCFARLASQLRRYGVHRV